MSKSSDAEKENPYRSPLSEGAASHPDRTIYDVLTWYVNIAFAIGVAALLAIFAFDALRILLR